MGSLLLRHVHLVPVDRPALTGVVDLRITDGEVVALGGDLAAQPDDEIVDADGRWAMPGLWDQHVHFTQWAQTRTRVDVGGTDSPDRVVDILASHIADHPDDDWVLGYGFRLAEWDREPGPDHLDALGDRRAIVMTSGDAHAGWLNARACEVLGLGRDQWLFVEEEWFDLLPRVIERTAALDSGSAVVEAVADATALGVVGIVDFEFDRAFRTWTERNAAGIDQVRVRPATYLADLEEVLDEGWRTGVSLTPDGRVTMGPLKIIADGSLNSRTAFCRRAYRDEDPWQNFGGLNLDVSSLKALARRAHEAGLELALHAIGDAAVDVVLGVFAHSRATGSIEHAQLTLPRDVERLAALGVRASVQPAHLLDDRDTAVALWPAAADHCFAYQSMAHAGVPLALGSDAPVARLDPWEAMAAAVHRSADEREPWNPAESLTVGQALAASTDGRGTLVVGSSGDVILLDDDPLRSFETTAETAAHLRGMRVAATYLAGRQTHRSF